jgi:hypothetical protein
VKKNIENNCRKDLEKLDAIKKRSLKQQQAAYENKRDNKFDGVEKKNKITERKNRSHAYIKKTNQEINKVSMVYYRRYQAEANDRKEQVKEMDKMNSAMEFKINKENRRFSAAPDAAIEFSPDRDEAAKSALN